MSNLFAPSDGLARWQRALAAIIELAPGETITHEDLADAVGDTYRPGCGAINRAMRELRRNHKRSMTAVYGVGYRVLHPHEHVHTSGRAVRRSRRALVRAHEEITSADRTRLAAADLRVADQHELVIGRLLQNVTAESRRAATARRLADKERGDQ